MAQKILLTDDDPFILNILKKRFEAQKLEVFTATNGLSCIQQAKEKKPDIIVLDVLMPGMTGHGTCKQLKADLETKEIPVIMFSADLRVGHQSFCIEEGAVGLIYKPDLKVLVDAVKAILAGKKFPTGFD